jgi:hypothetical protein
MPMRDGEEFKLGHYQRKGWAMESRWRASGATDAAQYVAERMDRGFWRGVGCSGF